ncbi:MAG: TIGR00282 family metallophosphoesterase [Pirellulaceae bacterium]|nr:TIGR00282 family metallophosphoesterase [Planctomycetaceae bacterium]MDG2102986.1 TIGR00282 family metallophosphoesterase [Pirellulaceae bacterium]
MRIFFIGDIVGKPGVEIVQQVVPALRRNESIDIVIANGENAESGSGITPSIYRKLKDAEVDCITLGDHAFRKRDIIDTLDSKTDILRPANFPTEAPGQGFTIIKTGTGTKVAVINLIGRVFMKPADCPFHAADQILSQIPDDVPVRFVDFHAEATSDKQLMGHHLDGRVSAMIGTHTHVPTADEHIKQGGTAFLCDVGMTGPHDSILGRSKECVFETTYSFRPRTFHVAKKDSRISGVLIDVDRKTGKAQSIRRLTIDEKQADLLEDMD